MKALTLTHEELASLTKLAPSAADEAVRTKLRAHLQAVQADVYALVVPGINADAPWEMP